MYNIQKKLAVTTLSMLFALTGAWSSTALGAREDPPLKDPPRWSTEDITPQARYQTAKKEAGAALEESRRECRSLTVPERNACMKEAQAQFVNDMAAARKELQQ